MENKKEKGLVTGGAGFMGSHIADCLTFHGFQVVIFDSIKSPYLGKDQVSIVGSIEDEKLLCQAMEGCKYVYHLAGIADIDECFKRPFDAVNINILGTARVLECAAKSGIKKIIFASSAYVASGKGSFYRISKVAGESLMQEYAEKYGFKFTNLRYGTLYGPRSDERNNLYRILNEILNTKCFKHRGNGEEVREFIHVLDAAGLSVKALSPEFDNQTLLLTGYQSISYKSLFSMIKEILGSEIKLEYNMEDYSNHYVLTPYAYRPDVCRKMIPEVMVDFGQGIVDLITEINVKKDK